MGRLPTVILLRGLLAVGVCMALACEEPKQGKRPLRRQEAIHAPGPSASPVPDAASKPAPPRPRRVLCPSPGLDRALPAVRFVPMAVQGQDPLPERVPASGRFTWVSLWAAWCGPCKEEAPRLRRWQQQLTPDLELVHVSLDDDRRQLVRELSSPRAAIRSSYWLPEGQARDRWLRELGLKEEPTLPVQILVGASGRIRCIIDGAVEDADFPEVEALVRGR